ncbi:hypothetical protein NDU88_002460 [Pleurodeles waltl]|uniref:Uncharacterized protein n=1 Tax=Pleurodeles waltl TaxID=8319 RepID=A0AAV7Q701_PLEWA|nr:hypothetical protein NDU88_002460 [Pleurodeles waltl]
MSDPAEVRQDGGIDELLDCHQEGPGPPGLPLETVGTGLSYRAAVWQSRWREFWQQEAWRAHDQGIDYEACGSGADGESHGLKLCAATTESRSWLGGTAEE